jgi:hypothetical protein
MLFTVNASAQEADEAALAQQIQNPLASVISLPMQFNFNEGVGQYDRRFLNLNVQPVIPYPGENWNLITRTIIPINSVPVGETDSVFGFGDTNLSLWWSPAKAGSVTWGLGPSFTIPTASNPEVLGSDKLSIGPTGVLFISTGKWTMGAVASNVWSVAGNSDREDVNLFFAQWFVNFNFGGGWAVGSAPIILQLDGGLREPVDDSLGPPDLQAHPFRLPSGKPPARLLQELRTPGGRRRLPGPIPDQPLVPPETALTGGGGPPGSGVPAGRAVVPYVCGAHGLARPHGGAATFLFAELSKYVIF